jgi:uncharacterized protein (UPF0303 family)
MGLAEDVAKVAEQERTLVFKRFDEGDALAVGSKLRELAAAKGEALSIDIRFWNRQLFFYAMPGTSADNLEWMRRKSNVVRRFNRASYHFTLRHRQEDKTFAFDSGVDHAEYAAHGGSFPIRIEGVGVVGYSWSSSYQTAGRKRLTAGQN